jgi:hypothetical protein
MESVDSLAERHILESESHLRHIDELMARASHPSVSASVSTEVQEKLSQIQADRIRLAQELKDLRLGLGTGGGSDAAVRGAGLNSALRAVGLQLEHVITAIFDRRGV